MKVTFAILSLMLFFTLANTITASDVHISPSTQTVDIGDTIIINISCIPSQPIKAFEFSLSFNPAIIQAVSVKEGDIFAGHNTFFNEGAINNTQGTITQIYNLIIGQGNISERGTLITITFSAVSAGTTEIDFIDNGWTGICNETGYLSINLSGATIVVNEESSGNGSSGSGGDTVPPNPASPSEDGRGGNSISGIGLISLIIAVGIAFRIIRRYNLF